ncbi:MAG: tetraacyldisaccharide 4'-kinase [Pseudomonadales bacterium]
MAALEEAWYSDKSWPRILKPLSWVFARASGYRKKTLLDTDRWRSPVPVLVVGNISVGGTGKTPVIVALVNFLIQQGLKPGVVSRGYGGKAAEYPLSLTENTRAAEAGDEPVLIFRRCACPVVVGPDRVACAQQLLTENAVDVILSDDGLQHYALDRDLEIAVIDGKRGLGNGLLLPAGPLREGPERLQEVNWVLVNGGNWGRSGIDTVDFFVRPDRFINMDSGEALAAAQWLNSPCHAVAGIGHPERFFDTLEHLGIEFQSHCFPDHHNFTASDIDFAEKVAVVMTEKDAVKCFSFADKRHWYLSVSVDLDPQFLDDVLTQIRAAALQGS